jgi:GR25 family glycosyltransferase involved in LPS biosynthesis
MERNDERSTASDSPLLRFFDRVSIVNLPQRRDRRREIEAQLRMIGIDPNHERVEFFPAIRPAAQEDWPTIGARGCFLTHHAILQKARDHRLQNILVLEDDCDFTPSLVTFQEELIGMLAAERWDVVYLGHLLDSFHPDSTQARHKPRLIPWSASVPGSHCYALNSTMLDRAVTFFGLVAERPEGHPLGGPQHYDGALSMLRWQHQDAITLIASPALAVQRSSRSDVTGRWFDAVPGLRSAAGMSRRLRRRVKTVLNR